MLLVLWPAQWIGRVNLICETIGLLIATLGFYYMSRRCEKFPFTHRKLVTMATMNISLIPVCLYGIVVQILPELEIPCRYALWPPLLGAVSQISILIELLELHIKSVLSAVHRQRIELAVKQLDLYRFLASDAFVKTLLFIMTILFIVFGFGPPYLYPGDFFGHFPHCDVRNLWHHIAALSAIILGLIQAAVCTFIYRSHQDEDGVFMRFTLFGCTLYTCFICTLMIILKLYLDPVLFFTYDFYGLAMSVSHMISGSLYTMYPLYKSFTSSSSPESKKKRADFERILLSPTEYPKFHHFACEEHAQNEVLFWKAVQFLFSVSDKHKKLKQVLDIYKNLVPEIIGRLPYHLQAEMKKSQRIVHKLDAAGLDLIFERAQEHMFKNLCANMYDRFLERKTPAEEKRSDSSEGLELHQPQPSPVTTSVLSFHVPSPASPGTRPAALEETRTSNPQPSETQELDQADRETTKKKQEDQTPLVAAAVERSASREPWCPRYRILNILQVLGIIGFVVFLGYLAFPHAFE